MVKGKAKPVQAWALGDVIGSRTRDASVQLPLIGRNKELAELRARARRTQRRGQGWLVELVGEPGIGKSRLIEELHAEQEAHVLLATAEAFTSSSPYIVWRALLRELLGVRLGGRRRDGGPAPAGRDRGGRPGRSTPWLPLIAIPLDVDVPMTPEVDQLGREFRQPKLHEVVGRFLAATIVEPTLIHVEDAHLMDGASSELFVVPAARASRSVRGSAR